MTREPETFSASTAPGQLITLSQWDGTAFGGVTENEPGVDLRRFDSAAHREQAVAGGGGTGQ